MKCHICENNLTITRGYSSELFFDCKNSNCELRNVVQRCRLILNKHISDLNFRYCSFWIKKDRFWYEINIFYNKKMSVIRHLFRDIPYKPPCSRALEVKPILDVNYSFNISKTDDLIVKVPSLLKRIENLVILS